MLTKELYEIYSQKALEFAKKENVMISYDPNYRASLWTDAETAKREM